MWTIYTWVETRSDELCVDCIVKLESCTEPDRVMYCAHPVSGTGNNSLMYCYNMKPVSTFPMCIYHVFSRGYLSVSVCWMVGMLLAFEMVFSDVVSVYADFLNPSLVSSFMCSQRLHSVCSLTDVIQHSASVRNGFTCATFIKVRDTVSQHPFIWVYLQWGRTELVGTSPPLHRTFAGI